MTALIAGLTTATALVVAGWSLRTSAAAETSPTVAWLCAALAPLAVLVALAGAVGLAVPGFYGP